MPLDGTGLPDLDESKCGRTYCVIVFCFFPNMLETNATNLENGFVTQRSISMKTKHIVTLS